MLIFLGFKDSIPWVAHYHYLRHLRENFKKATNLMKISDVKFLCCNIYIIDNTNDV